MIVIMSDVEKAFWEVGHLPFVCQFAKERCAEADRQVQMIFFSLRKLYKF